MRRSRRGITVKRVQRRNAWVAFLVLAGALAPGCGEAEGENGPDELDDGVLASGLLPAASRCESDEDCNGSLRCAEVISGYRACLDPSPPTTDPSLDPESDQCDGTRPCPGGSRCYFGLTYPSGICGLGGASPRNACRADECTSGDECESGFCAPPGLDTDALQSGGGVRRCVEARCRSDAGCTTRAGGKCALVDGYCAGALPDDSSLDGGYQPPRLACVYPDGCVAQADCPDRSACRLIADASVCVALP